MNKNNKSTLISYLFLSPSLLLIFIFSILPVFMVFYFSFTDFNIIQTPKFVGFKNYLQLSSDIFFKPALINTLSMTLFIVPTQTILSLLLASIFARKLKSPFDSFVKNALFIPVVASPILVGAVWRILYAPDSGEINALLNMLSLPSVDWLGDSSLVLMSISIVSIWKNVGYFMVIYLVAILEIPKTYYEAAELDGASAFHKFIYITLPHLRPITFLVVTLGSIWTLQSFELAYTMTGGGPGTSTITIVYNIYNAGFKFFNMGYASAISTVLFMIILTISLIQKRFSKKED